MYDSESECPIYLEEGGAPTPGDCSSYPSSCKDIPCRYHSIGDHVYDYARDIVYRIKSFNCYGNCHIPIFNLEFLEPVDLERGIKHNSTACYLIKATDENDISFYGPSVKAK